MANESVSATLNGTSSLIVELGEEGKVERKVFPLRKVSEKELFKIRLNGKPGFVLKVYEDLYYATIPRNLRLVSQLWPSKCGCCQNCYPSKCQRVSDRSCTSLSKEGMRFFDAVELGWRIEKYPFINAGFQTFNTSNDVFGVRKCDCFEISRPDDVSKLTLLQHKQAKFALGEFMYDDLVDEDDLNNRLIKNGVKW